MSRLRKALQLVIDQAKIAQMFTFIWLRLSQQVNYNGRFLPVGSGNITATQVCKHPGKDQSLRQWRKPARLQRALIPGRKPDQLGTVCQEDSPAAVKRVDQNVLARISYANYEVDLILRVYKDMHRILQITVEQGEEIIKIIRKEYPEG